MLVSVGINPIGPGKLPHLFGPRLAAMRRAQAGPNDLAVQNGRDAEIFKLEGVTDG